MISQFFISLAGQTLNRKDLFLFQFCRYKPNVFLAHTVNYQSSFPPEHKECRLQTLLTRECGRALSGLRQLFWERLSEKMCTRQSGKVLWDMLKILFLTLYLSNLLLSLSFSICRLNVYGLSCHSFKFLWKTVNSKPPTIPFGVVACTSNDNLSQNSCIWDIPHHQLNWLTK